ncbi:glycosyltransferase [Natrinema thermotolerans]
MLSGQLGAAGTPQVILNITKHLHDKIDVEVAYLGGKNELVPGFEQHDINVHRLGDNPLSVKSVISLRQHLQKHNYDLVHTHMVTGGAIGRVVSKFTQIPVISTVHTSYDNRPVTAKVPDLLTSPFAAANVCVSDSVKQSLPTVYKRGAQTEVVHNCIDVEQARQTGAVTWDDLEWTTDIDREEQLIVNVARYDPKKRREDLIKALPDVLEVCPRTKLVLTGEGPRKEVIQDLAEDHNVADNVAFVGFVENPQSIYHHADIVALPSVSEGFSISMLEAMAHGKPIVATDIPPFREALGDNHAYVEPQSPMELGEQLRQVLSDDRKAKRLGNRAYKRVCENFSGEAAAKEYEKIYRSVLRDTQE